MQRRGFLAALSAPAIHMSNETGVTYRAVAASHVPGVLVSDARTPFIEVRRYRGSVSVAREVETLLGGHGAQVVHRDGLTFQLGFSSLDARGSAWDAITADPLWPMLRDASGLVVEEISLYSAWPR